MNPGRELDALIAEKVMGWTYDELTGWDSPGGEMTGQPDPRHYSTSIACAWEVVDKLRKSYGFSLQDWPDRPSDGYEAEFSFREGAGEGYPSYSAEAKTAPHAICLAAIKAFTPPDPNAPDPFARFRNKKT